MKSTFLQLIFACIILLIFNEKVNAQCAAASNVVHFVHAGKSYEVIKESKTWATAASCAVTRGGYLVEINSTAEQTAVYTAITTTAGVSTTYTTVSDGGGIAYVWIGATDQMTEGTWLWDGNNDNTGSNFWNGEGSAGAGGGSAVGGAYNNWGGSSAGPPNEPDDFGGNQDAAAIGLAGWPAFNPGFYGNATEWNDIAITNTIYYVVEYNCLKTTTNTSQTLCSNDTLIFGTQILTSADAGSNTEIFTSAAGCDSTVVLNLIINPVAMPGSINVTFCDTTNGIIVLGQLIDTTGTTNITLPNMASNGCDSSVNVIANEITCVPLITIPDTQYVTMCAGEVDTICPTSDDLASLDSIIIVNCSDGTAYEYGSVMVEPATGCGLYIAGSVAANYGDTVCVIAFDTSGNPDTTIWIMTVDGSSNSINEIILLSDSFLFDNQVLYPADTGLHVGTFSTSNGCDSIVNLTLEASRVHIGATTSCLEIFPCPINKYVTIQGLLSNYNITIINNAGTTVATVNNTGSIVHIDTSTLSAGTKRVKIIDPLNPDVCIIKIIKP